MSVRVRYAPSPTGMLHVGALRTVLFDHLYARQNGGQNILRVEDTDRNRYDPTSEREMIETLKWAGIEFDEGPHVGGPHAPYRQSERKALGLYGTWTDRLLAHGHAYKAFETTEELEALRRSREANKEAPGYFGGVWRDATPDQVEAAERAGKSFVVRQRIPRDRKIVTRDAIRGDVEVDASLLPDPVLLKTDGMPTYHLAAIVDDHLMEITHVFRGDEWLPSFPQHWLLYEQFGWTPPVYVHCPVIVGKDGKKLSKRHGATRVLDYGAMGYLKGVLLNFVALIGWSPGDERELMTEEEMIASFSLQGVQSSPGRFDIDKLRWMNGERIRAMPTEDLLDVLLEFVRDPYTEKFWMNSEEDDPAEPKVDGPRVFGHLQRIEERSARDRPYLLAALKEVQPRVATLADFGEALEFFLVEDPSMDEQAVEKWFREPHAAALFDRVIAEAPNLHQAEPGRYEQLLRDFQTQTGLDKLGPVVHPMRVALTGKTAGPGLFELMAILGADRIVHRLRRAKEMLWT